MKHITFCGENDSSSPSVKRRKTHMPHTYNTNPDNQCVYCLYTSFLAVQSCCPCNDLFTEYHNIVFKRKRRKEARPGQDTTQHNTTKTQQNTKKVKNKNIFFPPLLFTRSSNFSAPSISEYTSTNKSHIRTTHT